jgi:Mg-chelatase subunit ChlD
MNSATSRRLVSTRTADVTPLGTAGQRSFELIRREVAALGLEAAALFAEPFAAPEGDAVDWYGEGSGPVFRLDAAPEPPRSEARATLNRLVAAVTERADALLKDRDEERRRLGEALRNAIEVPGDDSVYVIGAQPVLVCWAHRNNVARPRIGVLTQRFAAAPSPTAPLPAATQFAETVIVAPLVWPVRAGGTLGWLWWLLWGAIGALAVVVAVLLLPACGVAGGGWLDRCPVPAAAAAVPETDRSAALSAQLEALQRQLRDADQVCRPERQVLHCPPDRSRETTFLLDASGSMNTRMGGDPQIDRELQELSRKADPDGTFPNAADARRYAQLEQQTQAALGDKRIDVAKRALFHVLEHANFPPVRLGTFSACGETRMSGPFPDAAAAHAAIGRVQAVSSTALAEAITLAVETLDGGRTTDDPANIVLIGDGPDTCGGDPCAAAQAAKAARPGLRIDVIDLAGQPQLQCVAELTGGTYQVAPRNAEPAALASLIAKSARRPVPAGCELPEDHAVRAAENDSFDQRVAREQGITDGPLQVTLIWETQSDLDLKLYCPGGEKIMHSNKNACGGVLNIDQNTGSSLTSSPVENIFFTAPPKVGAYRVVVHNFKQRGGASNVFQLRIVKNGEIRIEQGQLMRKNETAEFSFYYP